VLNFEVHSQQFSCVEQLVALKEKQINSQWKQWDIKSTWGEIQWNIWMKVWIPLLPTSQLQAGKSVFLVSSSCVNGIAVGLESQKRSFADEGWLLTPGFLPYDLVCNSPVSHSPGSAETFLSPLWYLPSVRLILLH